MTLTDILLLIILLVELYSVFILTKKLERLKVGQVAGQPIESKKESVLEILGPPSALGPVSPDDYQILEYKNGFWQHHSWREKSHPDVMFYSKHPRFNVMRPDGSLVRSDELSGFGPPAA